MKWTEMLSVAEKARLDKLDAEIAALRVTRYQLQNAATKRAQRQGKKKRKSRTAQQEESATA